MKYISSLSAIILSATALMSAPTAQAQHSFMGLAVISQTTDANHLCAAGADSDVELLCNDRNPELLTGGIISATGVSVSGVISASSLFVNGSEITGSGLWNESGSDIYYSSGNVGIATAAPSRTLSVSGTIWSNALELSPVVGGAPVSISVASGAESDPQVGTLTSAKWCTSDGTTVNCTEDAPSAGSDNLGSHTASTTLVMASNNITGAGNVSASTVTLGGDTSSCTSANYGTITYNSADGFFYVCRP